MFLLATLSTTKVLRRAYTHNLKTDSRRPFARPSRSSIGFAFRPSCRSPVDSLSKVRENSTLSSVVGVLEFVVLPLPPGSVAALLGTDDGCLLGRSEGRELGMREGARDTDGFGDVVGVELGLADVVGAEIIVGSDEGIDDGYEDSNMLCESVALFAISVVLDPSVVLAVEFDATVALLASDGSLDGAP